MSDIFVIYRDVNLSMGPSKIHAKQSVEVDLAEWEEMLLSVSVIRQNVEFGNPGSLYLAFAFMSFFPI